MMIGAIIKNESGLSTRLENSWQRLFRRALALVVVWIANPIFAADNNISGTCINDVGRGALLWGTSSEVTTYSEPYFSYKTPYIYRIPTTAEQTAETIPQSSLQDAGARMGVAMERLAERGTIIGADGKVYEYYYARGVEPRRVLETRRVQKGPNVWVDEQVQRIEARPTLIRVLRPAGTTQREAEREASLATAANSPKPCEPTGGAERQTYADPVADRRTIQNDANSNQSAPPVEGSSQTLQAEETASVRVITPLAQTKPPQMSRPILVLPEELRKQTPVPNNAVKTASDLRINQATPSSTVANPLTTRLADPRQSTRR